MRALVMLLVRVRLLLFCCVLVASEPGLDIIPFLV